MASHEEKEREREARFRQHQADQIFLTPFGKFNKFLAAFMWIPAIICFIAGAHNAGLICLGIGFVCALLYQATKP